MEKIRKEIKIMIIEKVIDGILKFFLFIAVSPLYLLQWIGFKLQPKSKEDFLDNKYNNRD